MNSGYRPSLYCYVVGKYKTWTLDWTGLWTGLNYELIRKMLKLFSIAFYSVVSTTKFM